MAYVSNPWRDKLLPAYFRNTQKGGLEAMFHVESSSKESGRRIVTHEFPKKDLPYAEDMGRRAMEFSVRAYCIAYPYKPEKHGPGSFPREELYQEDYTRARDSLMAHLDAEGPGILQLPNGHGGLRPIMVVCQRYRMTEEQRLGGYCTFDISFVELGAPPFRESRNSQLNLVEESNRLKQRVNNNIAGPAARSAGTPVQQTRELIPTSRIAGTQRTADSRLVRPPMRPWIAASMAEGPGLIWNAERGRWEYGEAVDVSPTGTGPGLTELPHGPEYIGNEVDVWETRGSTTGRWRWSPDPVQPSGAMGTTTGQWQWSLEPITPSDVRGSTFEPWSWGPGRYGPDYWVPWNRDR